MELKAVAAEDVAIAGGGLAGLSAAVALAQAGLHVRLFEARPRLGGRATSYLLPDGAYVDNCQHVTMGCCANLADFYRRIGSADKIRSYRRLIFLGAGGTGVIEPSSLPAPFHLAPSFCRFPLLGWAEKRAIARSLFSIARNGGHPPATAANQTMMDWLQRQKQPQNAIERFWRVVLVSALNEDLDRAGAVYGMDVFWKAFLSTRRGFELGIPSVPLADLYEGCREIISARGGEVQTDAGVRAIVLEGGRVVALELDSGAQIGAGAFVAALPHQRLLRILPERLAREDPGLRGLGNLRSSPIVGVHLWLDRPVMEDPFAAVLDRTIQWIFNKSALHAAADRSGSRRTPGEKSAAPGEPQYLQLVVSASYDLIGRARDEIIRLCLEELADLLPAARQAQVVKALVIKEAAATFSPTPDCDRWRLPQRSSVPNLFLAGDWTQTGWPATMEGAVRSGYLVAEAVLQRHGRPQKLLQPDLPAEGIARLLYK